MTNILLIEDAVDLANAIRRELEGNGYSVRHASDGAAGLLLFKKEAPDLVILDWMLPKLNGLDEQHDQTVFVIFPCYRNMGKWRTGSIQKLMSAQCFFTWHS